MNHLTEAEMARYRQILFRASAEMTELEKSVKSLDATAAPHIAAMKLYAMAHLRVATDEEMHQEHIRELAVDVGWNGRDWPVEARVFKKFGPGSKGQWIENLRLGLLRRLKKKYGPKYHAKIEEDINFLFYARSGTKHE